MSEQSASHEGGGREPDAVLRADELLPELERLQDAPLRDHVTVFENVHRRLTEALDEAEG